MLYVAVDIGCIECAEATSVLGVFTEQAHAEAVIIDHERRQDAVWHGEHRFKVFEVEEIDKVQVVEYV